MSAKVIAAGNEMVDKVELKENIDNNRREPI